MSQLRRLLRFQDIPLGIVLVVPFVLEVMGAVGLTAYFSYRHGQASIHEMAQRLLGEVSDRVDRQLTHYLELPVQVTDEVSTNLSAGFVPTGDAAQLEGYFQHRLERANQGRSALELVFLVDRQNHLVAVEKTAPGRWNLYRRNAATQAQLRSQSLEVNGQQPRSLYDTRFELTQDPFQEKVWQPKLRQAQTGLWQVIALTRDEQTKFFMTYLQPFQRGNGKLQGVVGAAINLEKISHSLTAEMAHQGQAFIVESTGALVAASNGEPFTTLQKYPLRQTAATSILDVLPSQQRSRLQAIRSPNSTIRHAAQHITQEIGTFDQITTARQLTFTSQDKPYYLQVTPIRTPTQLNWVLVVAVPKSNFAAQMEDHYQTMMLLSGGALLAAIALGLITARQITRPIQRLNRASQALMLDQLDQPVEEHSRIRELAVMAHSFNKMIEHLVESFDQVNLALQESTEKFTTIFRTSPDPILITTLPEGKILEVNESFLRLTGYTPAAIVDSTAMDLGLWVNLADRQKLLQAIEATGHVYNQEVNTISQHGIPMTVLLSSEKIELEGKPCLLTIAKDITERKRLEEALRQSEAKLHDVLNSAAAAICYFYVDEAGTLRSVYFSAGAQSVFGYSPETLLVRPGVWQQRVHADDWQHIVMPGFNRVAAGQSLALEYRYDHPDGRWRWISADIITRWEPQQQRWLVTSVEFDITARKQAEEALRLSEERFRMAFDSALIGMDIAAPDGRLLKVNPALCQMLGYSEADLLRCSYRDITHPEDKGIDQAVNLKILRQEVASETFEKRFIHKDGQTIWTMVSLALVRDFEQEPIYWVAQIQDITVRKQAEQTMRESESRFRAVFETAALGIAIATLQGRIVEANDTFCGITGYDKIALQQMKLQDIVHPDDLYRWQRLMQNLDQQWLDHHQIKACCVRKDGEFQWVQLTTLLIRDASHNPQHLVVRIEVLPVTIHPAIGDLTEVETWRQ